MFANYLKKHRYVDSRYLALHSDENVQKLAAKYDLRIYRPKGGADLQIPEKLMAALDQAVQVCRTLGRNAPAFITSDTILPIAGNIDMDTRVFLHSVDIILTLPEV